MPDETVKPGNPLPKLRLTDERDGVALRLRTKGWLLATFHDTTFTAQHLNLPRIASAIVAACNAYPGLVARVAALEAENARMREALDKADEMVPWFRQGTIWVGGRADHAERVIAGLDQLSPTKYTQECVDTFRGWVNETHKRIGEYESSRAVLAPKEPQ